jgi:hypothetical protein
MCFYLSLLSEQIAFCLKALPSCLQYCNKTVLLVRWNFLRIYTLRTLILLNLDSEVADFLKQTLTYFLAIIEFTIGSCLSGSKLIIN